MRQTPPWEWPEGTDKMLVDKLRDRGTNAHDRLLAAELAGDLVVINEQLVESLLSILQSKDESESLRGQAALSLGPVLELADMDGFEDPDDIPISEVSFNQIQKSLRELYLDAGVPKELRRLILEASVRAPQDWHQGAARAAYSSDDEAWSLTAVFCMRFVRGFDEQILKALDSDNAEIHCNAVIAAGNWELDAAWPHIAALVTSDKTDKPLLLAAIGAIATVRPEEALDILNDLIDSDDEDIVDAVQEAIAMAEGLLNDDEDEDDKDEDTLPN